MFTFQDFFEPLDGVSQLHVLAGVVSELLCHIEWLAKEALDAASAAHQLLVVFGQFFHTKNGNDVLQVLVALQNALHFAGYLVVFFAYDFRVQNG